MWQPPKRQGNPDFPGTRSLWPLALATRAPVAGPAVAVGSDAVRVRPLCAVSNAVARAAGRCIQKALARVELLLRCGPDEFLATVPADQLLILKVHEATLRRGSRFQSA